MSLSRSKSAPHVAESSTHLRPFTAPSLSSHSRVPARHPKIQRHASALAISTSSLSYASSHLNSPHSGVQTPRLYRKEDPFSLSGFFPAFSGAYDRSEEVEWDWLHYEVEESDLVGAGIAFADASTQSPAAYLPPVSSEDEEWALPTTPPLASPMFDRKEDEVCGETIRREDKLGVLSLANPFSPPSKLDSGLATAFMQPPPMLLSPYSEDNPLDSDALYNALCALRNSKSQSQGGSEPVSGGVGPSCGLFSSVEEEGGLVDSDLETLGTRGLGRLLDMLPL